MPPPILEVPRAEIPSYEPLVVPPNMLRPPPGIKGINIGDEPPQEEQEQEKKKEEEKKEDTKENTKEQLTKLNKLNTNLPPEAQIVEIPFTDIEIPMPTTTIMTTAATTAFISVAATLAATSLFKYLVMAMKPIMKTTWNKLTKKKEPKVS